MSIFADPKKIKALAIDLDGTLLAPGPVLTERTARAVKACIRRGLKIIIATGRAAESAEPFRSALGAEGPMVYYNGALIADMSENKILHATLMDRKAVEFCLELSRTSGVYCQVYCSGGNSFAGSGGSGISLLTEKDAPEREMYRNHTGILAELGNPGEPEGAEARDCVKVMFIAEPEVLVKIRPELEAHFKDGAYIAQTHRTFLEVLDAKASKGRGLEFVMERCSLKSEEVIAFGDEENDLPMFDAAGFSAAPSSAKDIVKAKAGLIIGPNTEDGVAAFLEEFFAL